VLALAVKKLLETVIELTDIACDTWQNRLASPEAMLLNKLGKRFQPNMWLGKTRTLKKLRAS
jgi:hypothetical protein